jgi:hypothetical protein
MMGRQGEARGGMGLGTRLGRSGERLYTYRRVIRADKADGDCTLQHSLFVVFLI